MGPVHLSPPRRHTICSRTSMTAPALLDARYACVPGDVAGTVDGSLPKSVGGWNHICRHYQSTERPVQRFGWCIVDQTKPWNFSMWCVGVGSRFAMCACQVCPIHTHSPLRPLTHASQAQLTWCVRNSHQPNSKSHLCSKIPPSCNNTQLIVFS